MSQFDEETTAALAAIQARQEEVLDALDKDLPQGRSAAEVAYMALRAAEELDPAYTGCHKRAGSEGFSVWAVLGMLMRDVVEEMSAVRPDFSPEVTFVPLSAKRINMRVPAVTAARYDQHQPVILVDDDPSSVQALVALLQEILAALFPFGASGDEA